jgi:NADH dehydrogenase
MTTAAGRWLISSRPGGCGRSCRRFCRRPKPGPPARRSRRRLHRHRSRRPRGSCFSTRLAGTLPGLAGQRIWWMLRDPRACCRTRSHLSNTAERVLRRRGSRCVPANRSPRPSTATSSSPPGRKVPTRSLIWCLGVRPDPLVDGLGLDTNRGRPVVDEFMSVPAASDIYARRGQVCGMTAQHAQRQGKRGARNVAASLGIGKASHTSTTTRASWRTWAAWPRREPAGRPAVRGCRQRGHQGLPPVAKSGNQLRVLADWAQNAVTSRGSQHRSG